MARASISAVDLPEATGAEPDGFSAFDALDLLDWKHAIFDLYAAVRADDDPERAWRRWRETRDRLFAEHPQSPLPEDARATFRGGAYHPYDPAWRVVASVEELPTAHAELAVSTGGTFGFTRVGLAHFALGGVEHRLELTWNEGYGGGLFVAFTDATSGDTSYGGGRYLVDTVKGADLGFDRDRGTLVLDFNFAFNPSCSYDPRWACPLAPPGNRLPLAVTAGEQHVALAG